MQPWNMDIKLNFHSMLYTMWQALSIKIIKPSPTNYEPWCEARVYYNYKDAWQS